MSMKIGIAGPFNPYMVREYLDSSNVPDINISATAVNLYVRGLLELGHEVTIFTANPVKGKTEILTGKNIKIYLIPSRLRYSIFGKMLFGRARMAYYIRPEIEKEINNLDILHAEWTYEYAYAVKKYKDKLPIFCSVRDWCPYLLTLLRGLRDYYYWYMSYFLYLGVMNTKEFYFIANSDYTMKKIVDRYPNRKVSLIPNPLLSQNIIRTKEEHPIVYISISQSLDDPRKNYASLLEAFEKYTKLRPEAKLILIGGYSEKFKQKYQSENVILLGNVSYSEIFSNLDKANVLIHPSLEETFGNILLEAMCRRVLCIGGKESGAVPQVLGYGKYGLLCDVSNPDDIVNTMLKSEDNDLRMKLLDDSTDYIEETYTENIIAKKHIALFEKVLGGGGTQLIESDIEPFTRQ